MTRQTFMNALPIVASAYGRKFGVQVAVGGGNAYTDGKRICIPSIKDTPEARVIAWGYLAHEGAHIRWSDFAVAAEAERRGPLLKFLTNILEDVRIEQRISEVYPGTRGTLKAMWTACVANGDMAAPNPHGAPGDFLCMAILWIVRARYAGIDACRDGAQSAWDLLQQVFPPAVCAGLDRLLPAVATLDSSSAALELASRILAMLQETAQNTNPPPQSGGDGKPKETGTTDSKPEQQQPGDGTTGQRDPDQASSGDKPQQRRVGNGQERTTSTAAGTQAQREQLQDALAQQGMPGDMIDKIRDRLAGAADPHAASVMLHPLVEQWPGNPADGKERLRRVKDTSHKLTVRLQSIVEAHRLEQRRITDRGRRLSGAHLHRVAIGDGRVFAKAERKEAPNTAVHLVVDLSSSMSTAGRHRIALDTAMALTWALQGVHGVSVAATAFPGIKTENAGVVPLIAHGERIEQVAGRFTQFSRGGTPMTGALWFAASDLVPRQEPRKIVITITDGMPNDWEGTRNMIRLAKDGGLEMIAIGIGAKAGTVVRNLFPVAASILDVTELKAALFEIAERLLLT